ncbi:hypothetical protein ABIF13_004179 [Bradyrhizobium elkanii]
MAPTTLPAAIDGRDRHRRMVEEAHETHLGGALRIGMLVAGAADHQRARGARRAVGAEGELVIEPHRHGLAAAHPQVDVEHLGLDLARHRRNRGQQRRAVARDDVGQFQAARADLGQIVVQPVGQRGVDIGDLAGRIDREEAAWRVIEIFDRVPQLLEHVFLALAVAGDVGDRPNRIFRIALAFAERAYPQPQPATLPGLVAGDADLLLLPLALAGSLQKAEHGLGDVGVADEDPLDRTDLLRPGRAGQREIGGVGIDHVAAGVGDDEPFLGLVGDPRHHRIIGGTVGEADDAGGKGEQVEQPDGGEQRQHAEDIGLRLGAADGHQPDRHRDDAGGDQDHQQDAAVPPRWPVGHERLGHGRIVAIGGHLERHGSSASRRRPAGHLAPECLNRTRKRKSNRRQFRKLRAFQAGFPPLTDAGRTGRASAASRSR